MRHVPLVSVLAAALLLVVPAGAAPGSRVRREIRQGLETALARIDRTPADLAVRDVRFWEEQAAAVRARGGALPFPFPGGKKRRTPAIGG